MNRKTAAVLLLVLLLAPQAHGQSDQLFVPALFRDHTAMMLVIDPDSGQILAANTAAVHYYGYSHEQLLKMKIQQINTLTGVETQQEFSRAARAQRNYFIFRHRLANGEIRPVEVYSSPTIIKDRKLLVSIIHDASERDVLKETIVQNESRLRYAEKVAQIGHWTLNLKNNSYQFSEGALKLLGLDATTQPLATIREMVLPEYRALMSASLNHLILEEDPYNINLRFKRPDGHIIDLNSQGTYDPETEQVFGVIHDITTPQEVLRQLATRTAFFNRMAVTAVLILLAIVTLLYYAVRRSKRAETALHQSKTSLQENHDMIQLLLDSTAEGIYGIDRQGNCTFCNTAGVRILGYQQTEELVGRNIHQLIHHSHEDGTLAAPDECPLLRNLDHKIHRAEEIFWHADGSSFPVEYWSYPLQRADQTIGAVVTFFDISKRKSQETALRESEARNRALLDAIPDMMFVLDNDGVFIDARIPPGAPLLFEHTHQFLGQKISTLVPARIADPALAAITQIQQTGQTQRFEYQLKIRGIERSYESRVVRCTETSYLAVVRDISEKKLADQALHQKNREMEHFVYSVSHDLRSPLVTIKSFLSMLRKDLETDAKEQIEEDFHYLIGAADKMDQLLAALLQLSHIGRSDRPPQIISVKELVDQSLNSLAGPLREKNIRIDIDEMPFELDGDPVRLGQIWQNLIENAIKYMGDQEQPLINIGVVEQEHEQTPVFYVRDNGMGIAAEHSERIFALFAQLNTRSSGSGLGLAMVKKIVELYQGKVWLASEGENKGSCFYFTLPRSLLPRGEQQ